MTEYWISNPKHYCEICNTWCDAKAGQIKLHEAGEKHVKNVENYHKRRKREKWLKEKEDQIARKEMEKIENAALQAFEQDRALGHAGTKRSSANALTYNMESKLNSAGTYQKSYLKETIQEQLDRLQREHGFTVDTDISDLPTTREEPEPGTEPPERDGWFYCDDGGTIKGPFKTEEMAKWYDEGWFKPTLKVRNQAEGAYKYLKEMENPFFIHEYKAKNRREKKKQIWQEEQARLAESSDDDSDSDSSDPEPPPPVQKKELRVDADFSVQKQETTVEAPEAEISRNEISTAIEIDPIFGTAIWSVPEKMESKKKTKSRFKTEKGAEDADSDGHSDHEMDDKLDVAKAYGLDSMRKGVRRKVREATAGIDKNVKNSFVSTTFQKRKKRKRNNRMRKVASSRD